MRYLIFLLFLLHTLSAEVPMTYRDIVEISRPEVIQLAPNGNELAYVTRRGDIEANCNRDSVFTGTVERAEFTKLAEYEKVIQLTWNNDSSCLYVLCKESELYRISRFSAQKSEILCEQKEPIHLFTLSSNEDHLYYTLVKMSSEEQAKKLKEEGYVFDWDNDQANVLTNETFLFLDHEEIWDINLHTHAANMITSLPNGSFRYDDIPLIRRMQVSESGNSLLLFVSRFGDVSIGESGFSGDPAVWDLSTHKWALPVAPASRERYAPTWVGETQFVYFVPSDERSPGTLRLYDLSTMQERIFNCLPPGFAFDDFYWDKKNSLLYGKSWSGYLYRIDLASDRSEIVELPGKCGSANFDSECRRLAYVVESSNVPPEIYCYDVATKQNKRLTTLNPQLATIAHGYVEAINEKSESGLPINGYLVHPVNEQAGVRYPIIIATYGFDGKYVSQAEVHSSFPAQPLAADGYFVFLLNHLSCGQEVVGDFQKAQELAGWDTLAIFEAAVDLVEKKGGDSDKVGIYGWSHGSFLVSFCLTHSTKFHAACILDGLNYNPGAFWFGGRLTQELYDNLFGGPPWGETLKNYLDFNPFYQVEKISAPLLFEFSGGGIAGLELYSPLRYLGVPAEHVTYVGEEHNFVRPKARIAAMGRKADWFNYWLLGKKDVSPAKEEQYRRWDRMKSVYQAKKLQGT